MILCGRGAGSCADQSTLPPAQPKTWRGLGAAISSATVVSALALLTPSSAWAACTSPNTTSCTVDTTFNNNGVFDNGDAFNPGTVAIQSGGVFNNAIGSGTFYNSGTVTIQGGGVFNNSSSYWNSNYRSGTVTILDGGTFNNITEFINGGDIDETGVVTIQDGGLFNNDGNFYNGGVYYGSTGIVTIQSGGVFNSDGNFYNGSSGVGSFYHFFHSTFTGSVTIESDAAFNNNGAFYNGGTNGIGTVTVQDGGVFNNDGQFVNGHLSGYFFNSNTPGTGIVSIMSGGTFNNNGAFYNGGNGSIGTVSIADGGLFNHFAGNSIGNDNVANAVTFANSGTFNIGYGNPALATTNYTGTYTQSATGALALRADWAGNTSDKLAITGTATLAGTIVVTPLNFPSTGGLTKTFAGIVTAKNPIIDHGIGVTATAAVDYELLKSANQIDLVATINFQGIETGGLTPNHNNVGGAVNGIFNGGTSLGFMPPLLTLASNGELGGALDQLAPSGAGAGNISTLQGIGPFTGQLLSCRTLGEGDANAIIHEGQCVWARGTVRQASIDNGGLSYGADETAPLYSAGAQLDIGGPWRLGGGIGYETSRLDSDAGSHTETDRLHLGAVLKYNPGPLLLAATVTGGFGWSDSVRNVKCGGFAATATSDYDSDYISGRFTAAYLVLFGGLYLKPQVDFGYAHISRDGYREQGTGGIALAVAGSNDGVWSASPMLEIGTEVALAGGGVARPFVRGGLTWRDQDGFITNATFLDAPGSAAFSVTSEIDRVTADIAAGLDLITPSDTALRLQYDGQFGDTIDQHIGSAKLSLKY